MNWTLKKFEDLTLTELYAILHLRNEVFVVEQNCIYLDVDNLDQSAWHLMGWQDDNLIAYTRIFPPGISYKEPAIGRVVTSPKNRRSGFVKELMLQSISACEKLFGNTPITLSAQLYLKNFYTSLGFNAVSDVYLEDGIEHVKMTREDSRKNP